MKIEDNLASRFSLAAVTDRKQKLQSDDMSDSERQRHQSEQND